MLQKLRLIFYFGVRTLIFNLIISMLGVVFISVVIAMYGGLSEILSQAPFALAISGLSAGHVFGVLAYYIFRRYEIFMYLAHGIKPYILLISGYFTNAAVFASILFIAWSLPS